MSMAMNRAKSFIDRLLSAGYPSFVVQGELEKAKIRQRSYSVTGFEEPQERDYTIIFSMPPTALSSKATYDEISEVAREFGLEIRSHISQSTRLPLIHLVRKMSSRWRRFNAENPYDPVAEISSETLKINAELPDAGEILEAIGSKVYAAIA